MDQSDHLQPIQNGKIETEVPDEALQFMRRLSLHSPEDTFQRFRRRVTVVQETRMLFESQVTGFWIVLDAFLRIVFTGRSLQTEATSSQRDQA